MQSRRSDGILVLGIISIVFGVWSLFHHFGSQFLILQDYSRLLQTRGPVATQLYYFQWIFSLLSYLFFIVSGLAVLRMKNWGRILLIIISGIDFAATLILPYIWTAIMSDTYHKTWFFPTPIPILYVINIWFLNKKRIREQFKLRPNSEKAKGGSP